MGCRFAFTYYTASTAAFKITMVMFTPDIFSPKNQSDKSFLDEHSRLSLWQVMFGDVDRTITDFASTHENAALRKTSRCS